MGVPKFYRWLSERYPKINQPLYCPPTKDAPLPSHFGSSDVDTKRKSSTTNDDDDDKSTTTSTSTTGTETSDHSDVTTTTKQFEKPRRSKYSVADAYYNNVPQPVLTTTSDEHAPVYQFDRLYLDMNGILHGCSHSNGLFDAAVTSDSDSESDNFVVDRTKMTQQEMIQYMCFYLDRIVEDIATPSELLYCAIDGVAPRAKMNQQRSRRYRSGKEQDIAHGLELLEAQQAAQAQQVQAAQSKTSNKEGDEGFVKTVDGRYTGTMNLNTNEDDATVNEKASSNSSGVSILPEDSNVADDEQDGTFHSNSITPGTKFLYDISEGIRTHIEGKLLEQHPKWKHLQIIWSGPDVPGEGEHKIMQYMREYQNSSEEYDPNKRHCIVGQDGDLIMLALATHERNICLLRERVLFGMERLRQERQFQAGILSGGSTISDDADYDLFEKETNNETTTQTKDDEWTQLLQDGLTSTVMDEQTLLNTGVRGMVRNYVTNTDFELLHINILKEYLSMEFETSNMYETSSYNFDVDRTVDDFILLTFLVGNDFLPHMPSIDIADHAFDLLFNHYKRHRSKWQQDYHNNNAVIEENTKTKKILNATTEDDYVNAMEEETSSTPPPIIEPYLTENGKILCFDRLEYFLRGLGTKDTTFLETKSSKEKDLLEQIRKDDIRYGRHRHRHRHTKGGEDDEDEFVIGSTASEDQLEQVKSIRNEQYEQMLEDTVLGRTSNGKKPLKRFRPVTSTGRLPRRRHILARKAAKERKLAAEEREEKEREVSAATFVNNKFELYDVNDNVEGGTPTSTVGSASSSTSSSSSSIPLLDKLWGLLNFSIGGSTNSDETKGKTSPKNGVVSDTTTTTSDTTSTTTNASSSSSASLLPPIEEAVTNERSLHKKGGGHEGTNTCSSGPAWRKLSNKSGGGGGGNVNTNSSSSSSSSSTNKKISHSHHGNSSTGSRHRKGYHPMTTKHSYQHYQKYKRGGGGGGNKGRNAGGYYNNNHSIEEEQEDYKGKYYFEKFHFKPLDVEQHLHLRRSYLEGLVWNLEYYFGGCLSWSWYYPYHYGPMFSDLRDLRLLSEDISFKESLETNQVEGTPLKPFDQLLACLPPSSAHLLTNSKYRYLLQSTESPLKEYYPRRFTVDMNGKRNPWEAVVLLPFINVSHLQSVVNEYIPFESLSKEEQLLNTPGQTFTLKYNETSKDIEHVPLSTTLDNNENPQNYYRPRFESSRSSSFVTTIGGEEQKEQSRPVVAAFGFSTLLDANLQGLKLSGRKCISVHGLRSNYRTSLLDMSHLQLPIEQIPPLPELALSLVGKTTYINYPHLSEAFVTGVADTTGMFRGKAIEGVEASSSGKFELDMKLFQSKEEQFEYLVLEDALRRMYHEGNDTLGSGGWLLPEPSRNELKILLSVRPLWNVCSDKNGVLQKEYAPYEIFVPFVTTLWKPQVTNPLLEKAQMKLEVNPFQYGTLNIQEITFGTAHVNMSTDTTSDTETPKQRTLPPKFDDSLYPHVLPKGVRYQLRLSRKLFLSKGETSIKATNNAVAVAMGGGRHKHATRRGAGRLSSIRTPPKIKYLPPPLPLLKAAGSETTKKKLAASGSGNTSSFSTMTTNNTKLGIRGMQQQYRRLLPTTTSSRYTSRTMYQSLHNSSFNVVTTSRNNVLVQLRDVSMGGRRRVGGGRTPVLSFGAVAVSATAIAAATAAAANTNRFG